MRIEYFTIFCEPNQFNSQSESILLNFPFIPRAFDISIASDFSSAFDISTRHWWLTLLANCNSTNDSGISVARTIWILATSIPPRGPSSPAQNTPPRQTIWVLSVPSWTSGQTWSERVSSCYRSLRTSTWRRLFRTRGTVFSKRTWRQHPHQRLGPRRSWALNFSTVLKFFLKIYVLTRKRARLNCAESNLLILLISSL